MDNASSSRYTGIGECLTFQGRLAVGYDNLWMVF